jgi:thiamine pyrophosphate-dependent acetolactate synthase large subunit-like protein
LGWGYNTNLGFSWGVVMAAKLMWPEKLCVNWIGDAAMGHNMSDMETARRENLPILTVVSNNSGYSIYGPREKSWIPKNVKAVLPSSDISYATVAEGLGWYGERVEEPDDIIPALNRGIRAVNTGKPALIEVITSFEIERISPSIPAKYQPGKPL